MYHRRLKPRSLECLWICDGSRSSCLLLPTLLVGSEKLVNVLHLFQNQIFNTSWIAIIGNNQTSLDAEKTGNPTICRHCYKEGSALSKRDFDLRRSKEELRAKMKRSDMFFSRRKRGHANIESKIGIAVSTSAATNLSSPLQLAMSLNDPADKQSRKKLP